MNVKAIPAAPSPCSEDTPHQIPNGSQVAMVVMLVPIPAPSAGAAPAEPALPPSYVDAHDHVWLVVDKASPMAAVFQQITAAEPAAMPANGHLQASDDHGAWVDALADEAAHPELPAPRAEPLSRREIDVLRLMADGRSNKEIAQSLILALNTIKMHVKHIYGKLGVRNRVQAVDQARLLGLLATTMR